MTHVRRSRQERFQARRSAPSTGAIWGFVPDDSWVARDGVLTRLATYRPCCQDPRNRRPDGEPCALASADVLDTRASYRYVRDVTCSCGVRVIAHEWLLEPPGGAVPVFDRGDRVRVRLGLLSGLEAFVGKLLPGAGCQGYALRHPQHPDLIAPLPACALELIAAAPRRRSAATKESG